MATVTRRWRSGGERVLDFFVGAAVPIAFGVVLVVAYQVGRSSAMLEMGPRMGEIERRLHELKRSEPAAPVKGTDAGSARMPLLGRWGRELPSSA